MTARKRELFSANYDKFQTTKQNKKIIIKENEVDPSNIIP